ncbi:MAG: ferrous iron transport protein B [Deltaproteobacteria bacterium]|nr:MAG: ferrous iron transport protein B [Deltaproteobacteria bacterium]
MSPAGRQAPEKSGASAAVVTAPRAERPSVLLAGNPNSGKTTLFNALTGARAKVGNYPGITVDRRSAKLDLEGGLGLEVVDLPGTYSLSARSAEEEVAAAAVLGLHEPVPAAVVVVVDASALRRGLYLAQQVVETGLPTVVALSMMDEARSAGIVIDAEELGRRLGAPCIPIVAPRREGLDALRAAIGDAVAKDADLPDVADIDLPEAATEKLEAIEAVVEDWLAPETLALRRAWARWALLSVGGDELPDIPEAVRVAVDEATREDDPGPLLIALRYERIDAFVDAAVTIEEGAPEVSITERVDRVILHPILGFALFAVVMALLFQGLFAWSDPAIGLVEDAIAALQNLVAGLMPEGPVKRLVVHGVIAGVGNVLVFVPQIALLFLFIGILEDSGYLARVAFVLDRLMGGVGLHGKAFVPMLSGFACAIPAVMATRTIESRRDRILTMMVVPLTSCSARLPVYVLIIAAVFSPDQGGFVLFAMYFLSVIAALGAAFVLRRTVLKGKKPPLVLELPPYRMPMGKNLALNTWERVRSFLVDAGTVILALTIVVWGLSSYPRDEGVAAEYAALRAEASQVIVESGALDDRLSELEGQETSAQLPYSFAATLGHAIEPVIEPLGFDWRIGVGIIGAFAAREVFVSTVGIVFGLAHADEESAPLRESLVAATWPDGRPLFTPLSGLSLMIFFVLASQCMSTLAVVKKETGGYRWPTFLFVYMTVLAYVVSFLVFQVGTAMGWGTG